MTERLGWYETRAEEAAARYESVAAERINEWLLDLLPKPPALVLDVGSGSRAGIARDSGSRPVRRPGADQPVPAQGQPSVRQRLIPAASSSDVRGIFEKPFGFLLPRQA